MVINTILETHSSYLVNQLGKYIRNKLISSDTTSVYLFEKSKGITDITATNYDENGRIQRWPIGFLD